MSERPILRPKADKDASERRARAVPIMDAMEACMQEVSRQRTPSDGMGKALDYAYNLWPRLRRYALDGRNRIDNNPVERNQRMPVIGRKNCPFSKNDAGLLTTPYFILLSRVVILSELNRCPG